MRDEQMEVLVVGAGPVGLLTAALLAEAGIRVQVIDTEERTTTRSYACALHPRVLKLLSRLGLATELAERGRKVEKVAFYDGAERRAEVSLAQAGGPWPFLLILPQNVLEEALEGRLREKHGVSVNWNHRFDSCASDSGAVLAAVEQLGGTATGYIVPHWETVVQKRFELRARFLVGADGHNSQVRASLGLESKRISDPVAFSAWQFKSDAPSADEVRVVLDDATTNVLWPLAANESRWTFQLTKGDAAEFPEKDRRAVRVEQKAADEFARQYVQLMCAQRAPWYSGDVKDVTWCSEVVFEQRLAKQFGSGRCWLAGDAAHQTGPVGAQSMNVGMCEAESLAARLQKILRGGGPLSLLQDYDRECQAEWARLMGQPGGLKARSATGDWVRRRMARLLPCLPGSGQDLAPLAAQLGLDL